MSIRGKRSKGSSHESTQSSSPFGPSINPSSDVIRAATIFLMSVAGRTEPRPRRNRRSFLRLTATSRAGATRHQFVSTIQALPASPFVRCSLSRHRRQRAPEQEVHPAAPSGLSVPAAPLPGASRARHRRAGEQRSGLHPRGGTASPLSTVRRTRSSTLDPSPRRNVSVLALITSGMRRCSATSRAAAMRAHCSLIPNKRAGLPPWVLSSMLMPTTPTSSTAPTVVATSAGPAPYPASISALTGQETALTIVATARTMTSRLIRSAS